MIIFCIPCLVLVLYFLIAAIFFPRYKVYVREAWRCFSDKLKGKKCSFSFDNKMRLALSMWFAQRNMPRMGKFFYNKRNFNITFTIIGIVFTIVTTILFFFLIKFLIHSPCSGGTCSI